MGTVINIALRIQGNAQGALNALRQVQQALFGFGSGISSMSTASAQGSVSLQRLGGQANRTAQQMRSSFLGIQQSSSSLGDAFSRLASRVFLLNQLSYAVQRLGQAFVGIGTTVIGANAQLQDYMTRYTTLLGSAEAAQKRITQLQTLNVKSPFDLTQLIEADTILTAAGARTVAMLNNLSDAAAATGKPIDEIALAIGRLASGNFGEAFERLRELTIATRPMLEAKGLKFDASGQYLGSVQQALAAVQQIMTERFEGGAEAASRTFTGLLSNVRDAFFQIRAIFGAPIFDIAIREITKFYALLQDPAVIQAAAFMGQGVAAAIEIIISVASSVGSVISNVFGLLLGFFQDITGGIQDFVASFFAAIAPLSDAFSSLIAGDFGEAASLVVDVIANIGALIFRLISNLADDLVTGGINTIAAFADGMLEGAYSFIVDVLNEIGNMIADFLMGFSPPKEGPLSTIDTWFAPVLEAYLNGWTDADWGILTDMTDFVLSQLEYMQEQMLISAEEAQRIATGQGGSGLSIDRLIATVLDSINQTGMINGEALMRIQEQLGEQGAEIFKQLEAQFQGAVLDKEIRNLEARLKAASDPALMRKLDDSIAQAEDQIRNARNIRESRAGREQLKNAKAQKTAIERQTDALSRQIELLKDQRQLITDQVKGYEAILAIQKRQMDFMERIYKDETLAEKRLRLIKEGNLEELAKFDAKYGKQIADAAAKEAEAVLRAQEDLTLAFGDSNDRLEVYRARLARTKEGSAEYYEALLDVRQEEQAITEANEELAASQDDTTESLERLRRKQSQYAQGSAEWLRLEREIQAVEEKQRDAVREVALARADSAGKIALLTEMQKEYTAGSVEYIEIGQQIADLQKQQTDAAEEFAFSQMSVAEQIVYLQEQQKKFAEGSVEFYAIESQLADLEKKRAEQTQARLDAELAYQLAIGNSVQDRTMLEERLKKLDPNNPDDVQEYYQISAQLAAIDKERNDAALEYNLRQTDAAGQVAILEGELAKLPPQSKEWYDVQARIQALNEQIAAEAATQAEEKAAAEEKYKLSLLDTAGQIGYYQEKLAGLTPGTKEYYDTLTTIQNLQERLASEQAAAANKAAGAGDKLAESQEKYQLSLLDTAGQIAFLQEKLAGLEPGTKPYYDTLTKIEGLQKKLAREGAAAARAGVSGAAALEASQDRYNMSLLDTAGQIGYLEDKLKGLEPGTKPYYDTLYKIQQLQKKLAKEGSDASVQQQAQAKLRAEAEARYLDKMGQTNAAIAILKKQLEGLTPGTKEYFDTKTKIAALEQKAAKDTKDYNDSVADSMVLLKETAEIGFEGVDKISQAINQGAINWILWRGEFASGAKELVNMRVEAGTFIKTLDFKTPRAAFNSLVNLFIAFQGVAARIFGRIGDEIRAAFSFRHEGQTFLGNIQDALSGIQFVIYDELNKAFGGALDRVFGEFGRNVQNIGLLGAIQALLAKFNTELQAAFGTFSWEDVFRSAPVRIIAALIGLFSAVSFGPAVLPILASLATGLSGIGVLLAPVGLAFGRLLGALNPFGGAVARIATAAAKAGAPLTRLGLIGTHIASVFRGVGGLFLGLPKLMGPIGKAALALNGYFGTMIQAAMRLVLQLGGLGGVLVRLAGSGFGLLNIVFKIFLDFMLLAASYSRTLFTLFGTGGTRAIAFFNTALLRLLSIFPRLGVLILSMGSPFAFLGRALLTVTGGITGLFRTLALNLRIMSSFATVTGILRSAFTLLMSGITPITRVLLALIAPFGRLSTLLPLLSRALGPVFTLFRSGFGPLRLIVTAFSALMPFVGTFLGYVVSLLGPLGGLVGSFLGLLGPVAGLLGPLLAVLAPFGLILAAIAGLASASPMFMNLLTTWGARIGGWILEAIPVMIAGLQSIIGIIASFIIENTPRIIETLVGWGIAFGGFLMQAWPLVQEGLLGLWNNLQAGIAFYVPKIRDKLAEWAYEFLFWLQPEGIPIGASLGTYIGIILGKLGEGLLQVLGIIGKYALALVGWVIDALPGLGRSFVTLLGSIGTFLLDLGTKIVAWVTPYAKRFVEWIPGAAVEFLKNWPTILNTILDKIGGAVGPILAKLGEWALQFIAWIAPMLPDLALGLLAISAGILTFIAETAVVLIAKLIEWAGAFLGWVGTEVLPKLPGILGSIGTRIVELINTFGDTVNPKIEEFARNMMAALAKKVKEEITEFIGELKELGTQIFDAITSPFRDTKDEVVDHSIVPDMVSAITDVFSKLTGAPVDSVESLRDSAITKFENLRDQVVGKADAMRKSVEASFADQKRQVLLDANAQTEGVIGEAESQKLRVLEKYEELKKEAETKQGDQKTNTLRVLEEQKNEALTKIDQWKEGQLQRVQEQGTQTVAKLETMRADALGKIDLMKDQSLASIDTMKSETLAKTESMKNDHTAKLGTMASESYTKFELMRTEGLGRVTALKENVIGLASDFLTAAKSLGGNMVDGIIKGIEAAPQKLINALKSLATSALNAAKEVLGISSPSTVFAKEVGEEIPAGQAMGVYDGADVLYTAIESVNTTALSAVDDMAGDAQESSEKIFDLNFQEILKRAIDQFAVMRTELAATFTEMQEESAAIMAELGAAVSSSGEGSKEETLARYEELRERAARTFEALRDKTEATFSRLQEQTIDKVTELRDVTRQQFEKLKDEVAPRTEAMQEDTVAQATTMQEDTQTAVGTLSDQTKAAFLDIFTTIFDPQNQDATWTKAMFLMLDQLIQTGIKIIDALTTVRNNVLSSIDTLLGAAGERSSAFSSLGHSLGSSLGQGVVDGINSKADDVRAAMAALVAAGAGGAKAEGEISSPSGLTEREIGEPLGEGVIAGLENTYRDMRLSSVEAISVMLKALEGQLNRVHDALQRAFTVDLDELRWNLTNALRAIDLTVGQSRLDMMGMVGGNMRLPIASPFGSMGDVVFAPEITINGANLANEEIADMITARLARERETLLRQIVALRGGR